MKPVTPLTCLVHIACQVRTSHKKFAYAKKAKDGYVYVNKNEASINDLKALISELKNGNLSPEQKQIFNAALACLLARMLEKQNTEFFSPNNHLKSLCKLILDTMKALGKSIRSNNTTTTTTEEHARCQFSLEFKKIFNTTPKALTEKESFLVDILSKRIWDSSNVQKNDDEDKYAEYKKLMIEFYVGSHMLFEEESLEEDSSEDSDNSFFEYNDKSDSSSDHFFEENTEQVSDNESKSILNQIKTINPEQRVSSHYGKVGSERHNKRRGNQLPEILFHEGIFATKRNKKNNKLEINPGKYADKGKGKEKDQGEKNVKAFWIQTEHTPDGPNWLDWLQHRTLDFGQYFFLKNIVKSKRPQIAQYVGPKGRGRPDSSPIIIGLKK